MPDTKTTTGGLAENAEVRDYSEFEKFFSVPDDESEGIPFKAMDEELQRRMALREGSLVVDNFWGPMCAAVETAIIERGVQAGNEAAAKIEAAAFAEHAAKIYQQVCAAVAILQTRRNSKVQFIPNDETQAAADRIENDLNAVTVAIAGKLGTESPFNQLMSRINRAIHYVYKISPRVAHERARLDALLQRPEAPGQQ